MRSLWLVSVAIGLLPGAGASPEPHALTIHDMLAVRRISDAQVSPDGTRVAFTLRTTDMGANKGRTDVWLVPLSQRRLAPADEPLGERSPREMGARR